MFSEKIKDLRDLSAAHCFFAELQAIGVYPPITFPNYVSATIKVPEMPSHFLWNSLIEKLFSLALNINLADAILVSNSRVICEKSLTILLLIEVGVIFNYCVVGAAFSFLVPGFK